MFKAKNLVRLHDVDVAGRLYFPRQFRFVHEALEDFMESEGRSFSHVFNELDYLFVIVRCESNYYTPLVMGDRIEIHVYVDNIGNTSFTLRYIIFKEDGTKTGTVKTVHVCINKKTGEKIPVPQDLRDILIKHLVDV
ncbi:MAG: thioesterase family protein [Chlamydiota bacterium]